MRTRIIAVLNQKGGVGKTTTCVNLGAALARRGKRVLLIDMDPQANMTVHLGADFRHLKKSTYSLLLGEHPLAAAVLTTDDPNLRYVPSTLALANAEIQLASAVGRELLLREAIEVWLEDDTCGEPLPRVDYVFIDCPPSLGILTMNALCAAGEVLLPIQCEFFALQGVAGILESLKAVQRLNRGLELSMVVPCMVDKRKTLARDVIEEVEKYFGRLVTKTRIRNNVKLAEAPSHGLTIFGYDAASNGAKDYESLAREVLGESVDDVVATPAAPVAEPAPDAEPTPVAACVPQADAIEEDAVVETTIETPTETTTETTVEAVVDVPVEEPAAREPAVEAAVEVPFVAEAVVEAADAPPPAPIVESGLAELSETPSESPVASVPVSEPVSEPVAEPVAEPTAGDAPMASCETESVAAPQAIEPATSDATTEAATAGNSATADVEDDAGATALAESIRMFQCAGLTDVADEEIGVADVAGVAEDDAAATAHAEHDSAEPLREDADEEIAASNLVASDVVAHDAARTTEAHDAATLDAAVLDTVVGSSASAAGDPQHRTA